MVGLAVLAIVAWALNGAVARPTADKSGTNVADTGAALQPSTADTPSSAASPAGSSSAAAKVRGGAADRSPTPGASPSSHAAAVHHGPPACASADVVLSLFSAQGSYSARQTPEFDMDVVSTADRTCLFNVGASHLVLAVTQGSKQIWTSADCAEGQASLITRLRRGIPTVVPITWNGQRSAKGCPVPGKTAAPGDYTATATDDQLSSSPLPFRLG